VAYSPFPFLPIFHLQNLLKPLESFFELVALQQPCTENGNCIQSSEVDARHPPVTTAPHPLSCNTDFLCRRPPPGSLHRCIRIRSPPPYRCPPVPGEIASDQGRKVTQSWHSDAIFDGSEYVTHHRNVRGPLLHNLNCRSVSMAITKCRPTQDVSKNPTPYDQTLHKSYTATLRARCPIFFAVCKTGRRR
jgi:hypothetical protein